MGHWLHGMARRAEQIELNRSSCAEASARVLEALRVHGAKTKLALVGGDRRFESLPLQRRVINEPQGKVTAKAVAIAPPALRSHRQDTPPPRADPGLGRCNVVAQQARQ